MGDVVGFGRPTMCDIPPEKVLTGALGAGLSSVIVIGECLDGGLCHASSTGDIPAMLYALEVFKHQLMLLANE